ncbi:outer membrane lipoprotein omp16 precursor [Flavobacterium cauense R2A-7]|uniref:Outer membrane protein OmpA-like peptidoglycan-associated protein n=1 Tax=Flavobacterium cauense R2A-7 TaxID=1341154 RepID=V6S3B9_9FLAO|nr:OmpA family protein [Flavobacterium cauense]ESU18890.1 outer membrane lipoprotein omp16 precursor [Flavobacterium cauense R2A-7]KGO78831.1 flagellar motor protein MotB [Flavobacterium cauense R2A-7]TWI13674.1 outer membrane protein OmpA-like peptidoglycan-associated protein [Flavobacterium cauense R2A-7]
MKIKALLIITLFSIGTIYSQIGKQARADKKYDNYAYIDAIEVYEKVAEKGHKSVDLFEKLGNSYYFNGEYDKAEKWYSELFAMTEDVPAEYYFRYSQSLKSIGNYKKADEYQLKFYQKTNDKAGEEMLKNRNYLDELRKNSDRYVVENAGINTEFSDYGSMFKGADVIFTSARKTKDVFQKKHSWTGQYFTKLYTAKVADDGKLSDAQEFAKELDSKFHEATPVFTKDGNTVYFTRNNYNEGKKGKSDDKVNKLKIYKATLKDGKWEDIKELPFNNDNYSVAHPALSADEKTLYFSSDMPGTLGASDIFKVAINGDGTFGTPENLGSGINSPLRETFPYVTDKNVLYFSSDDHLGIGGLDVFEAKMNKDGSYTSVRNVGAPINSPKDDFGYIVNTKTHVGYFTSNRDGGVGSDDIYKFQENVCEQLIRGTITDMQTALALPGAKVSLFDANMELIKAVEADDKGDFAFEENIECDKKYYVRAEKTDYETKEINVSVPLKSGETRADIALEKRVMPIENGTDLAKIFDISIIYFDLDKWNIRPDAAVDLEKIIAVMEKYPKMKVDIRSHTDSRQTHKYNERLSDRRAKSTLEYMVKNGIDRSRLTAKGFGETQLINGCSDGVNCSEADHQKNRRSEFIVLSMD